MAFLSETFVTKAYDKKGKKMAERKGAGVYTGYKKNYSPAKKSKGAADRKVLQSIAGSGRLSEGGAGGVGKAAARLAMSLANKKAGVSSVTKRTGVAQADKKIATKSKRRIGTVGQAHGSVSKKAGKEIRAERKSSGEALYDKKYYGRKSVNQKMSKVPAKAKGGRRG